ncbi:MAG: SLC13 family permease [Phycisphaerales bacterium]|nr:SLC13 family permease [Phycisphaerales bacterium]
MAFEAWFTLAIIALIIVALISNRIGMDVAMLGGLVVLMAAGVVPVGKAIEGFASQAVLMIGGLYVVAAGMRETGAIEIAANRLLGRPASATEAKIRLLGPVALLSGFMNNTPIVAMCIPLVRNWSRRLEISPSTLYMPLSFAAILGGRLTMIGTASNLVVIGLFTQYMTQDHPWIVEMGISTPPEWVLFFGVGAIGLPCVVLGIIFIILTSRFLLPNRMPADSTPLDARTYQVEMIVQSDAPIAGSTIEHAGLRQLPGLFLSQIDRGGVIMPAVGPEEVLEAGDRLGFVGVLESVMDLRRIRGLEPATDQTTKLSGSTGSRTLVEVVVSANSPLVGHTVRGSRFRTRYNAAIIAVHRQGEKMEGKIGDIRLRIGDTLLLDTHVGFLESHRDDPDFYLISKVDESRPIRHDRAMISIGILALMVGLLIGGSHINIPPLLAVWISAMLMVFSRSVSGTVARASINLQVLVSIGAAIGLGAALEQSGAASSIVGWLIGGATEMQLHPTVMLLILFVIANALSQLITPYAASVLMFPIVMQAAELLGINPLAYVFTLMIAGCNFSTPIGYQTNLMVYGPGGYHFLDYAKLGIPLTILVAVICLIVAPAVFPY